MVIQSEELKKITAHARSAVIRNQFVKLGSYNIIFRTVNTKKLQILRYQNSYIA